MKKCLICHKEVERGKYNVKGQFVCDFCFNAYPNLHVDNFDVVDGKLVRKGPLEDLNEEDQRGACIDFIYTLYNQKVGKALFSMLGNLRKDYTWTGIIRAMEWFYVLKKNDLSKGNGSVGIVKYVYKEANDYYDLMNTNLYNHFLSQVKEKVEVAPTQVIIHKPKEKKNSIDVGGL